MYIPPLVVSKFSSFPSWLARFLQIILQSFQNDKAVKQKKLNKTTKGW